MGISNSEYIKDSKVKKDSKKNIKLGALIGYLSFFINILYGIFVIPWIAKSLGETYGIYSICLSLITLFLMDFGLSATTNVFVSKFRAQSKNKDIEKYVNTTFKLYLLIDLVVAIIFCALYFLIPLIYSDPNEWTAENIWYLQNSFLIVAIYSVISFPATIFTGIISSYEKYFFLKTIDLIGKFIHIVLSILCVLIFPLLGFGYYSLFGLVVAYALSGIFSVFAKYFYMIFKLHIKINIFEKFDFKYAKSIVSFSIFNAIIAICSRLIFTICPIIIGATSGPIQSGTFSFISTIEGYIFTFGSILSGFFIPKICRIYEEEKEKSSEKLNELAIKVGHLQLFFIGLIITGFICCGEEFTFLWLQDNEIYDYKIIYFGIILISTYQLVYVPQTVFNSAMLTKKEGVKTLSFLYIGRAIVNVLLASLLSYFLGAFGACISIFVVRTAELILENHFYKKILKVNLMKYFKEVFGKFVFVFALSLLFGLSLHIGLKYTDISEYIKFILVGFFVVIIYLIFYYLFQDKNIKSELRHRIKKFYLLKSQQQKKSCDNKKSKKINNKMLFAGLILSVLITFVVGLTFSIFDTSFGIAGEYVFYHNNIVVKKMVISSKNTLIYYEYDGDEYISENFKWHLTINRKIDDVPDYLIKSIYQFQICDDEWASYDQYYYQNGNFYSKNIFPEYDSKQMEFVKIK